jgi:hypothetical protein
MSSGIDKKKNQKVATAVKMAPDAKTKTRK